MRSTVELKLPVVDFTSPGLKPGTAEWTTVRNEVRQALESYGCFEALSEKVPVELQESMMGLFRELFDLPLQTKLRNVSSKPFHGYIGQESRVPLYESIGIDDADVDKKVDGLTTTLWPEGHPNFSKTIHSFAEKLSELDQMIRRMILESLGIEKYLDEHLNSTNYLLRASKYEGPQTTDPKLGLNSHTDQTITSILCQNEVDGLEVQTKDGEWFSARPSPNSFIVMIGDPLYAWVNGKLHSPHHRVMISGNKARYSAGLFAIPKGGHIIKTPDELVDEERPLLFKPFNYMEFLEFCNTEAAQRAQSALKTYCGV